MHRSTAFVAATGLASAGVATLAIASDTPDPLGRTAFSPTVAPQRGGHVYINSHTGERVITPHALPRVGRSERGSWGGWGNVYPDPCDPNDDPGEHGFWFQPIHDADLGDNPEANPLAVSAWQDWIETPGDARFSFIEISYATFVPDPEPTGGSIPGHDFYLAFTENDRATNRSAAVAHTPLAITDMPGDISGGAGTQWFVALDIGPDIVELGDTDNSTDNPQGIDIDGDGLIDSGYVFTYNQPGVGEGDIIAARFPELAGVFDEFTDPLDTDTFPNIVDIGPAIAHPSGNAGVNGEPDCYNLASGAGEWPRVPGCDDVPPAPLGTWDAYALIDSTGTDAGAYFFGGFACTDNGPGSPFNNPWASPYISFGYSSIPPNCPGKGTCGDVNGDHIIDLADIQAFVSYFMTSNECADLAPPFGVLDLADITAFAIAFQVGCP